MSNPARKISNDLVSRTLARDPVDQETARVLALRDGGRVLLGTPSGDFEAARAVSCLVAPEPGDVVLVARSPREGAFVLSILRREAAVPTTLAADGDLEVRLASGRFRVTAQEGVDLVSAGAVSVVAGGLDVDAATGNIVVRSLSFLGDAVRAEIDRVKLLAGSLDAVLDRLSQRVKQSYRTVEETDHVRAERIDYTAQKTMSLHAEHTLVTADALVKVDGEQIHLG